MDLQFHVTTKSTREYHSAAAYQYAVFNLRKSEDNMRQRPTEILLAKQQYIIQNSKDIYKIYKIM